MSESVAKSVKQEREEQKFEVRAEVKRLSGLTIFVIVVTVLATIVAVALYAQDEKPSGVQDKYSLMSPSGIAFSDFRGYEDWPAVSSARQDEILKVIVANPKMIAALGRRSWFLCSFRCRLLRTRRRRCADAGGCWQSLDIID